MNLASSSSFARLSPSAARIVLAVTLSAIALCMWITFSPWASGFADKPNRGAGDVELYQAEVHRIYGGEDYYQAAATELRARGYPTTSVFNWRTPLPMWLIGRLPGEWAGRLLIGGLAALVLILGTYITARDADPMAATMAGLLLVGALMPAWLGNVYVMPVVWAGALIALSACLYSLNLRGWAFGAGLAALFVRELAAPYCVICLLLAMKDRQQREVVAWLTGFALYVVFFAWHHTQVMSLIGPNEAVHANSWLQYGGASFVISLAQMNAYLLLLPQWVAAIFLVLALLGFAGWNTPTGQRVGLTACAFVSLFAFIGQPINQYWGSLLAPLLCLGAARSPAALAELFRRVTETSRSEQGSVATGLEQSGGV
ncbi:MAG: hypothetical protein IT427_08195 [Pirellulales bacterium]|nr:hypothetical protein [Pirellulales bacterium]